MRSSHEKPRSRSGGAAGEPALSNIISKGIGLLAKEEFLNLSSGCFWYVAEDDCFGYLEPGHAVATERNYFRSVEINAGATCDESTRGFAPFFVASSHYGGLQNAGMFHQHSLDFDGADILAAGYDDVLRSISDFDISIGMFDREISSVKPAIRESLGSGCRIVQIALHDNITPDHDFADGPAVGCNRRHRERLDNIHSFLKVIPHSLSCLDPCALRRRELIPLVFPFANDTGPIHLGQPVGLGDGKADLFGSRYDSRGGRRSRHHHC